MDGCKWRNFSETVPGFSLQSDPLNAPYAQLWQQTHESRDERYSPALEARTALLAATALLALFVRHVRPSFHVPVSSLSLTCAITPSFISPDS